LKIEVEGQAPCDSVAMIHPRLIKVQPNAELAAVDARPPARNKQRGSMSGLRIERHSGDQREAILEVIDGVMINSVMKNRLLL
jgi:hypothetical protein